jgi:alpha-tubulin suppressor-like RCC1 family protein
MVDESLLRTQLSTAIASLIGTESPEDLLLLSAAVNNLTTDRIVFVATENDLPDLYATGMPSGSIFFVDSLKILVFSVNYKWRSFDGRTLRNDAPVLIDAYAWGRNNYGQLGDGTTVSKSSPITVLGGITNWSQLSASTSHSLGVTTTGIAYAWGFGGSGVLGDGTTVSKSSPVSVIGGITNWSQVSAGDYYSLGLTSTGIAYSWGSNNYGRLGDGTTTARSSPVTVIGGITNWSQVSAGNGHSLGLIATGILYAWGRNNYGQLGDGTTTNRSSPITVIGGITNWSQLAAGNHSLGISV